MSCSKKYWVLSIGVLCILTFGVIEPSVAEPWLSNRYAANCAACHSPGRLNRKPKERRCTLSCQGCHVNPNGGGLRNQYGQWNSQRFLKSFQSDITWNNPLPAPYKKQKYAVKSLSKKKKRRYASRGARLVERSGASYDVKDYQDHENYQKIATNQVEELSQISAGDPYRVERSRSIYASGDFRFFLMQFDGDSLTDKQKEPLFWPMTFDLGVRIRPFRYHKLSFVYESRIFNASRGGSLDNLFGGQTGTGTRSAYLLYDDLPYNSYFQYGFYRPLFGLNNPNHTNLFADFTGLKQNSVYKGLGFGMAPNVPFFSFNLLTKSENPTAAGDEGFVVSAGLRGVTMGWSIVGSYWSTRKTEQGAESSRLMANLNGGGQFGRLTTNLDYTFVETAQFGQNAVSGAIVTVENKFRVWREFYAQLNYSSSTAAILSKILGGPGLAKGSASELAVGLKSFLVAGSEIEVLFQDRKNKEEFVGNTSYNFLSFQMHLYF